MVLEDKTLNNIVNFTSSYLLNSVLRGEELLNEFLADPLMLHLKGKRTEEEFLMSF